MEFISIILILLVIMLISNQKSAILNKIGVLEYQIDKLQRQLGKLQAKTEEQLKTQQAQETAVNLSIGPVPVPVPVVPPERVEEPKDSKDSKEQKEQKEQKEAIPAPRPTPVPPAPVQQTPSPAPAARAPQWQPEPELSFFERHPDLEKFIGENLVNKIGIAILVLSIGYFVKYAIDSNWIGPLGRVSIGILAGAILIGFAHKLRESYKAFSSVLVGGGLAVFYFTIALGFHQFHLFSQLTGLLFMVVITIFAVVLSLLYDKQELAVIALIGGLASPFMLSTGNANYNGLFLYLLILNAGLLVIAFYKSWRILNIVAFTLTVIIVSAVLFLVPKTFYPLTLLYTSVFYLLFFCINIAYNVRENKSFIASDFSILLINTTLYFSAGLWLLEAMGAGQYRGAFTASLALVNLALSWVLFRNRKVDSNILYLLIGITLTFISLTAPIQLKGNHITLFWACEAVLLYWLFLKSGIALTKLVAQIIWIAMLISLLMDWKAFYDSRQLYPVILNKGFITTLIAALSSFLLGWLAGNREGEEKGFDLPGRFIQLAGLVLLFLAGLFEVNQQFASRYPALGMNTLYLMLYVPLFVLALQLYNSRKSVLSAWSMLGILGGTIVVYLVCEPSFNETEVLVLELQKASMGHFAAHWLSAMIVAVLFYRLVFLSRELFSREIQGRLTWLLAAAAVLFLSLEVNLISNALFYSAGNPVHSIEAIYVKAGLPVLWGLSSFAMMWLGMKHKNQTLRVVSLSLFSLTLLKLFLFDIINIPAAGKIVAFFCLGVILLVVSFMYQRLKYILIKDEERVEE